jgi:hypothetical protein
LRTAADFLKNNQKDTVPLNRREDFTEFAILDGHGEQATIHIFPAVPVSVAIEIGRVRMPKSDLPLVVYDNIREKGFMPRLTIT